MLATKVGPTTSFKLQILKSKIHTLGNHSLCRCSLMLLWVKVFFTALEMQGSIGTVSITLPLLQDIVQLTLLDTRRALLA